MCASSGRHVVPRMSERNHGESLDKPSAIDISPRGLHTGGSVEVAPGVIDASAVALQLDAFSRIATVEPRWSPWFGWDPRSSPGSHFQQEPKSDPRGVLQIGQQRTMFMMHQSHHQHPCEVEFPNPRPQQVSPESWEQLDQINMEELVLAPCAHVKSCPHFSEDGGSVS